MVEIIYCHTYGRLSAGEYQELLAFCQKHCTNLTLIGIDELGLDLYMKYPRLAKDFLGVSVDTGQIHSLEDFIAIHDKNKMSAPLSTTFMFRESELKSAKDKLAQSSVLILSGPAGTGKTRLALKLCEEYANDSTYEILCVKNNYQEIYEDLIAAIEVGKDYLIFVDDANELTGLHFILDFLSKEPTAPRNIRKIILTVRNYALRQVVNQILKVDTPEILKVGLLKDEQIKKLLEESFEIINPIYLNHIAAIAEGNVRLAMLAGKLASNANTLESIRDASELYSSYYEDQIQAIAGSKTGLISAGIMAFFQALHLGHLKPLAPIFSAFKISEDQFISDLHQLHNQELVDLCHNKAAKISDQSFSNYLIKCVFADQKLFPFSQMIEYGFPINRLRTIEACDILLNVFSDEPLQKYIEQQICIAWESLKTDAKNFPAFFEAFHMIRPTDTLIILKDQIDQEANRSFDIHSVVFDKTKGEQNISDAIIKTLCSFADHPQLPEAIDLLLLYYQKRPDLFDQIYSAAAFYFGVTRYSAFINYDTQIEIVERLIAAVQTNPSEGNLLLFIRTAEEFLKLSFSRTEGGRKKTIIFYTLPLEADPIVIKYRRLLLEQLQRIYNSGNCHQEIESLLKDYCRDYKDNVSLELIQQEFDLTLQFFSVFSINNLYHCFIAKHIQSIAQHIGCDCEEILSPFLTSYKFNVYDSLIADRSAEHLKDLEAYTRRHREQVYELVKHYGPSEFQGMFQICRESLAIAGQDNWSLEQGISFAIDAFSKDKNLYVSIVKHYIDADTPYNVRADIILQNLFQIMSAEEVKSLILSADFSQQNTWLWHFYIELPENQISIEWANELLLYLQSPAINLSSSPYRPLDQIKKYECAEKRMFQKASKIIADHYDESPYIFNLYFSLLLNPHHISATELISYYQDDIKLIENIYLKCIAIPDYADNEGGVLSEIIDQDQDFLHVYLDEFSRKCSSYLGHNNTWLSRLSFIWKKETFLDYMDEVAGYLEESLAGTRTRYSSVLNQLLTPKSNDTCDRKKQELWIQTTIEKTYLDEERTYKLFCAIAEQGPERRRNALKRFLELNNDYALFEKLPLDSYIYGGWGSMIPDMQRRIDYLNSLLPMLTGIAFLKHKKKIEKDIESWKARIKRQEISELLESF